MAAGRSGKESTNKDEQIVESSATEEVSTPNYNLGDDAFDERGIVADLWKTRPEDAATILIEGYNKRHANAVEAYKNWYNSLDKDGEEYQLFNERISSNLLEELRRPVAEIPNKKVQLALIEERATAMRLIMRTLAGSGYNSARYSFDSSDLQSEYPYKRGPAEAKSRIPGKLKYARAEELLMQYYKNRINETLAVEFSDSGDTSKNASANAKSLMLAATKIHTASEALIIDESNQQYQPLEQYGRLTSNPEADFYPNGLKKLTEGMVNEVLEGLYGSTSRLPQITNGYPDHEQLGKQAAFDEPHEKMAVYDGVN